MRRCFSYRQNSNLTVKSAHLDERERMNRGEQALNWGFAENMAYATLLIKAFIFG